MRRTTSLLAAAVLVLGVGAPSAEAYVVEWRNETDLEGNGQILAVDQADGDVLAMTSPFGESQVVRRLDGRSGAVEWTAEVSGQATRIAVDPTDGRVVVAGAYRSPLRLTVLDRGGQVRQDLTTDVLMRSVVDLEVDPTSGLACTLGSQGRKNSEKRWMTTCLDRTAPSTSRRSGSLRTASRSPELPCTTFGGAARSAARTRAAWPSVARPLTFVEVNSPNLNPTVCPRHLMRDIRRQVMCDSPGLFRRSERLMFSVAAS